MPGGDCTGPLGQGPMTGRGMRRCVSGGRGGFGGGFGRGFGRGQGRGRMMGRGVMRWTEPASAASAGATDAVEALHQRLDQIEAELERLHAPVKQEDEA